MKTLLFMFIPLDQGLVAHFHYWFVSRENIVASKHTVDKLAA